jgi:hypothetical protein
MAMVPLREWSTPTLTVSSAVEGEAAKAAETAAVARSFWKWERVMMKMIGGFGGCSGEKARSWREPGTDLPAATD